MPFQLILILGAVAVLLVLAALRVRRMRAERDAPPTWQRIGIVAAALLVPPVVLQSLFGPTSPKGGSDVIGAVVPYDVALVGIWLVAWIAGPLVARLVPAEHRQIVLLALTGRDTSRIIPFDPPMPTTLAADVDRVEGLNTGFPRGVVFMQQAALPGFRSTWEALVDATRSLEAQIAVQQGMQAGVAERALAVASDARGRLETLRRDAVSQGQAWAV